ncbi:hypothetical protein AgCh_024317 [Apium graveolens]
MSLSIPIICSGDGDHISHYFYPSCFHFTRKMFPIYGIYWSNKLGAKNVYIGYAGHLDDRTLAKRLILK